MDERSDDKRQRTWSEHKACPVRYWSRGSFLGALRGAGAPIASVVLFFFAEGTLAPTLAWAQAGEHPNGSQRQAKPPASLSVQTTPSVLATDVTRPTETP